MRLQSKRIHGMTIFFQNEEEFEKIYKETFINEEYRFETSNNTPFILDCGSHIGVTILYHKFRFPRAKIMGFEPHPDNFAILTKNVTENNLSDVTLVNAALSDGEGRAELATTTETENPWTWGDSIVDNIYGIDRKNKKISVKTVKLSSYITQTVDLIKMDIEGMEQKVLQEIETRLSFVKKVIMELHQTNMAEKINNLTTVRNLLERNAFDVTVVEEDLNQCFPKGFPKEEFIERLNFHAFLLYATKRITHLA